MKVAIALSDMLIAPSFILPQIKKKVPQFQPLAVFNLQNPMFISKFSAVKTDIL